MKRNIGIIELFITAIVWGVAFVAQSVGMDYIGPCSFNAIRCLMGSIVLIPVILFIRKSNNREYEEKLAKGEEAVNANGNIPRTIKGGIYCGIALTAASLIQQYGILYTAVGKAGFITALYIIIVPFIGIFLGHKIGFKAWFAAFIAVAGFYFLCVSGSMTINKGDIYVLISAFIWSIHIHLVDHFVVDADCVMMSSIQFLVCAILCGIGMFAFETVTWEAVVSCAVPLLYAGIMSCGVAYTLQIVGQKHVEPTFACMILSLESVASAFAAWIILGQTMKLIEIFGCMLVFAGIVIAQLPKKEA